MTHADVGVRQASATAPDLGAMPVWNLGDLYPSPTSAEFRRDLDRAAADAKRIADSYKGKLGTLGKDGAALAKAVKAYEALSDVMGRLGSYAGLLYAADTTDPAKAKFYGDVQEKLTAISTDLVFFELELNQIAEADLAQPCGLRRSPSTSMPRSQLQPTRGRRLLGMSPNGNIHCGMREVFELVLWTSR